MTISPARIPSTTPLVLNSPLWQRAPVRDENGKPYIDFMMLIPGLNKECRRNVENFLQRIQGCLKTFESEVVYVDVNIRINILWISLKPVPGMSGQIARAIQKVIPHARLIASDVDSGINSGGRQKVSGWRQKIFKPIQQKWARLEKK